MNLSALSGASSVDVRDGVGIAVARKAQDAARQEGDAMVSMIRAAGEMVRQEGSGERTATGGVDVYA